MLSNCPFLSSKYYGFSLDFKVGRRSVSTVEISTLFQLKFDRDSFSIIWVVSLKPRFR